MSIGAKFPKTDSGISVMSFLVHNGLFSCRYSKKQFKSYAYAIRVREEGRTGARACRCGVAEGFAHAGTRSRLPVAGFAGKSFREIKYEECAQIGNIEAKDEFNFPNITRKKRKFQILIILIPLLTISSLYLLYKHIIG